MSRIILAFRIAPSVDLTPPPPAGKVGQYFTWSIIARGSNPPYGLEFATLPDGLSLSLTGLGPNLYYRISGTPTTPGDYTFPITATGGDRIPVVFDFTIRIADTPLQLSGAFVATAAGSPVDGSLTASGGTGPYTLTRVEGSVPGVTFSMASGVITATGNVTTAATYWLHFNIADSLGQAARVAYRLKVTTYSAHRYTAPNGNPYTSPSGDHYTSPLIED